MLTLNHRREPRSGAARLRPTTCLAALVIAPLLGCSLVLPFDEDKLNDTSGAAGSGGASTTTGSGGAGNADGGGGGATTGSTGTGAGSTGTGSTTGTETTTSTTTTTTTPTMTTTSTTTTAPPGPVVECGYPNETTCKVGELCCFDLTNPYQDFCENSGECKPNTEYAEIACDEESDCPGMHCCAILNLANGQLDSTVCKAACNLMLYELQACETDNDCPNNYPCGSLGRPDYSTYHFCFPG